MSQNLASWWKVRDGLKRKTIMKMSMARGTVYRGMLRSSAYRNPSRLSAQITPGEGQSLKVFVRVYNI